MAGLSGKQTIVDVVAASERLVPSRAPELPTGPPPELEVAAAAPTQVGSSCPFGHPNDAGAAFCASCGIKMGAQVGKPDLEAARPKPVSLLDEAERAERERQHAEAVAAAAAFEHAPEVIVPTSGQAILIHFTEDGLTAFGRVWYRGQELEIGPDHPRWADAVGWITLDRQDQVARWGRQYFDHGPWRGQRSYVDPNAVWDQKNGGPTKEALLQADEAERRRGRGVPVTAGQ